MQDNMKSCAFRLRDPIVLVEMIKNSTPYVDAGFDHELIKVVWLCEVAPFCATPRKTGRSLYNGGTKIDTSPLKETADYPWFKSAGEVAGIAW